MSANSPAEPAGDDTLMGFGDEDALPGETPAGPPTGAASAVEKPCWWHETVDSQLVQFAQYAKCCIKAKAFLLRASALKWGKTRYYCECSVKPLMVLCMDSIFTHTSMEGFIQWCRDSSLGSEQKMYACMLIVEGKRQQFLNIAKELVNVEIQRRVEEYKVQTWRHNGKFKFEHTRDEWGDITRRYDHTCEVWEGITAKDLNRDIAHIRTRVENLFSSNNDAFRCYFLECEDIGYDDFIRDVGKEGEQVFELYDHDLCFYDDDFSTVPEFITRIRDTLGCLLDTYEIEEAHYNKRDGWWPLCLVRSVEVTHKEYPEEWENYIYFDPIPVPSFEVHPCKDYDKFMRWFSPGPLIQQLQNVSPLDYKPGYTTRRRMTDCLQRSPF